MLGLWNGELSPRIALHLLYELPDDSRFIGLEGGGGPEHIGWNMDRYLRAAMVDSINFLTYAFLSANSKKKPKKPAQIKTPLTGKKSKGPNLFEAQVSAQLARLRSEGN